MKKPARSAVAASARGKLDPETSALLDRAIRLIENALEDDLPRGTV